MVWFGGVVVSHFSYESRVKWPEVSGYVCLRRESWDGEQHYYSAAAVKVCKLQPAQLNDGGADPRKAGGDILYKDVCSRLREA